MNNASLSLGQWLDRLQQLHPHEIDLGLERVAEVASRLALDLSPCQVVTVAGTNGKGSTVAALQAIALRHGLSVASYTSPHLLQFNERVQIDGQPVSDETLCHAFGEVDAHRGDVPLTYFEFATLAALYCLQQHQPHLCLLEVGLGGRLDAVNIIDADIAVVTNIQLDHQHFLGPDRETIALEKAGIFRPGVPAICAEYQTPSNLRRAAREAGAHWFQVGHDFDLVAGDAAAGCAWRWTGVDATGAALVCDGRHPLRLEPTVVAAAMQAACLLLPDPEQTLVAEAVTAAALPGRCQTVEVNGCQIVLDVAHNDAATARLVQFLQSQPVVGSTYMVLALMRDKAAAEMITRLGAVASHWYLPELAVARAYPAAELAGLVASDTPLIGGSVAAALAVIQARMQVGDRVVVTGSFYTVAEALTLLQQQREMDLE